MDPGADPDADWYLVGGQDGCDHERTSRLGGDTGNNQFFVCAACEGVLLRAGEDEDRAVREERDRAREARRNDPLDSMMDRVDAGRRGSGRSWLDRMLSRLFD